MVATLNSRSRRIARHRQARAVMEALESRELFSGTLLGIGAQLGSPKTSVLGNPGSLTYTASTRSFDAVASPIALQLTDGGRPIAVQPPQSFDLHIKVDNNGNLIPGSATNTDLVITGNIDIDGNGSIDYSGTLLTGKVTAFGWQDDGVAAPSDGDQFDFRFQVTGGALAPVFFTGKDAGVAMSVEQSTFTGSFCQNFSALTKGTVGPITPVATPPGTISGHKYQDMTGNGMSADDKVLAGWTINLYADANGNGKVDNGETLVASKVTAADGSYAFTGLAAGKYVVAEQTKSGWIQTGPVSGSYGVTVAAGDNKTNLDFDNFQQSDCACGLKCVYYVINGCKTVNDLSGQVHQGDTVKVVFTTTSSVTLSLVSYTAPDATFVADHAAQQKIFDVDTQTFGPGTHSLCVTVPDCYFQVDFVCGLPIDKFGPAGSNIFYTPQGRLIDSDNGGKNACGCGSTGNGSISGQVICDCNNNGKLDKGESGIKGIKITLTGTTTDGMSITLTTTTDANGNYSFGNLKAGTYSVSETDPSGYFDGKDTAGNLGGNAGNDVISNIVVGNGAKGTAYNFAELAGASISGTIFNDADKDGRQDRSEDGIKGVKITLTGTDDQGHAVSLSTYTDANGDYSFSNLRAGKYSLTETQPDGYTSTRNMAGSNGGSVCDNSITNICLNWCDEACGYNFGETKVCNPAPSCGGDDHHGSNDCSKPPVCNTGGNSGSNCDNGGSSNNNCSSLLSAIISLISAFLCKW